MGREEPGHIAGSPILCDTNTTMLKCILSTILAVLLAVGSIYIWEKDRSRQGTATNTNDERTIELYQDVIDAGSESKYTGINNGHYSKPLIAFVRPSMDGWVDHCDSHLGIWFRAPAGWMPRWNGISEYLTVVSPESNTRLPILQGEAPRWFGVNIVDYENPSARFKGITPENIRSGNIAPGVLSATSSLSLNQAKGVLIHTIFGDPDDAVAFIIFPERIIEVTFNPFFEGDNTTEDWIVFSGILHSLSLGMCYGGE